MHKNKYVTLRARFAAEFPNCFPQKGEPKKPLKIGIYKDLRAAAPDLTHTDVKGFICAYTRKQSYLRQMIPGTPRIALDGTSTEAVTPAHGARAMRQLAERLGKPIEELQAELAAA